MNSQAVIGRSLEWVRRFVIGLDLCPFAQRVVDAGELGWEVSAARDEENVYLDFLACLERFATAGEPETLLFVIPESLAGFDAYLDFLAQCEWAIEEAGLGERIQLASFHPDYCFEGVAADDPANYTNRSPWPMLHLLRHESVARATASHLDPEGIPERNCKRLREMGTAAVRRAAGIEPEA